MVAKLKDKSNRKCVYLKSRFCQILKFYLEDYPYLSLEDHNCQDHPHKAAKVYQKNFKKKVENLSGLVCRGGTNYLPHGTTHLKNLENHQEKL